MTDSLVTGLRNMIERGIITKDTAPDDFQWLELILKYVEEASTELRETFDGDSNDDEHDRAYELVSLVCDEPAEDSDDGEKTFENEYRCSTCGHEWDSTWSCQCDDDCPECGTTMTPFGGDGRPADTIEAMTAEYLAWRIENNLKIGPAYEHLIDDSLTERQRTWLRRFSERWKNVQDALTPLEKITTEDCGRVLGFADQFIENMEFYTKNPPDADERQSIADYRQCRPLMVAAPDLLAQLECLTQIIEHYNLNTSMGFAAKQARDVIAKAQINI